MKIKNFKFLKRFFALVLALVMIFNLSSDIFAQLAVSNNNSNNNFYFPQTQQYQQEIAKLSSELEAQRKQQEILALQGITFENFQKELKIYAKKNNIEYSTIDEKASWENYLANLNKYNQDYKILVNIFSKKTYQEVLSDGRYFLNKKDESIKYNGKFYNRTALIHATIHNFVTRQTNGYTSKGMFVFSKETAEPFSLEEKIGVMKYIYNAVEKEGFYPQDSKNLYLFTYNIVENGKKYFDNDIYKADILPGLANADDRQKRTNGQADRKKQADAVGAAIALLPVLSKTDTQKTQSAQVIYDLAKKVMRDDYGVIGISNGAQALIALKTEDSLNKLYTLLTEDLYRGLGTRVFMFALDSLSLEEWAKRDSGLANRIKGGLGQYHNAIARRYLYIDPRKNDADTMRLAQNSALEGFYNVVYTDMFEDIGEIIGQYSSNEKVARVANRLASKYLQDTANKIRGGEKKLHTSLITGILATTKQKNETLTKAANIIYNGSWWDINEATQRDKNNIAAKYLNLKKKAYNEQKKKDFKTICAGKTIGRFSDIAVNALFMGTLILSLPSIVKKVSTFSIFKIRNIKLKVKPADAKVAKETPSKPVQPKPAESKPLTTPKQQNINTPKEFTAKTEKVEIKTEEITPKQTEYTASVGEGGGGATASEAELSFDELSKMTRQQWLNEMATKLKRAREAQEIEAEIIANKGKISPYNRTWLVNKPWAELSPWRKTLATTLINLEFNREIFLSSLRILKPKYIGFSAPLPLSLTGEALLKPVSSVTQMTRTAESGLISTQAVFGAAQNAQRTAVFAKASGSSAGVINTNKAFSMLDMFQQYSAGKGLLAGNFGINGILNEFHGGASSGNSGLSTLEKENLIRANRTPQINSAVKTNNPYVDFMATQQNLNAEAKNIVKEAYKKHLKGDIVGAISEYDNAIKLSPMAVFYFGRGLLKYYNLNDYENAIADFKKAIQLNPEDETYKILLEEAQEKLTEKQNKGKKTAKDKNVKRDKDVDWFIKYLETLVDDYASENIFDPVSAQSEQTSFKKILSDLRKKLFASGNKKAKLYISILPITMSVVMKAVEVSVDLVNKVPEIKKAYNKAEERTLKLMERYNFSSQEAMEVFSDIFEKELTMANIPLERIQELLQEANNYMKGEHSVRLAQENSKEDTQAEFDEVNINTTADYDQTLAVLADDLRLYYDNQSNTWKYGYQQEPEEPFGTINLIQEHYIQGKIYYEKGQYQEAIAELDQVIAQNPYKTALEMRGQSKYNLGDYEGALADFNEVVAFGYNLAQDYFERGYTKERLGDYDGAIADYQKALKYNDINSDMYQIYESIYNNAIEKAQTAKENPVEPQTPETETQAKGDNEEISSKATEEENSVAAKEEKANSKINLFKIFIDLIKENFHFKKAMFNFYVLGNTEEALKNLSLAMQTEFLSARELAEYEEFFKEWSGGKTYEEYFKGKGFVNENNNASKNTLQRIKDNFFNFGKSGILFSTIIPLPIPPVLAEFLTGKITSQEFLDRLYGREPKSKDPKFYADKAREAISKGDIFGAINYYNLAIERDPNNALYHYYRAGLRDVKGALEDLNKAIELEPTNAVFYFDRAYLKDRYAKTNPLEDYTKAIELDPTNAGYYAARARAEYVSSYYKNAEEDYTKAIELESNVSDWYDKRGYIRDRYLNNIDGALEDYNKAIELSPSSSRYYYYRARLKRHKFKQFDEAKKDYLKAIELNPNNAAYYQGVADSEFLDGNYEVALGYYNKAISVDPNDPDLYMYRGRIKYKYLNDSKGGLEDCDKAIELDPTNAENYSKRGVLKSLYFSDYKGALADYNKAIELDPTNAEFYGRRAGLLYNDLNNVSAALKSLDQAIKYDPTNSEYYVKRAGIKRYYFRDTQGALEDLEKAIKIRVNDADLYSIMGDIKLSDVKDYPGALEAYTKAIELDPSVAEWYNKRGYIRDRYLNHYSAAMADYNKAIELESSEPLYYLNRANLKFYILNDKVSAFADYTKAIEVAPTTARYYFERAKRYYLTHEVDLAIKDMENAVKYDPERESYKNILKKWSEDSNIAPEQIEAEDIFEDNLKENSKGFIDILQGLRNRIFGPKSSGGKLYMSIIPVIPDTVIQLLTGDLTFEQLNNRTNAIQRAFDNAEETTIKTLKNIDSPVAIGFFLTILYQELEKAGVSKEQTNKVIEITQNYLREQLPQDVKREESMKALKNGFVLEQEGAPDEKILKFYDQAIAWDNTNARAYYRRAGIKFFLYDETAKDDYEKAIALDPKNKHYKEEYKLYLAVYREMKGLKTSVAELFKNFINKLSNILADLKNKAAKNEKSFTKDEKQIKAQDFAKRAYEKRLNGYKATSLAYYDEAIILDPSKAEYYYERALAKDQDLGDYDGAMADYISAMELDSQNADFYTENASKAISTKILRQEEAQKYADMFDFNISEGKYEEALENMNKAIELDSYNSNYYYLRGNLEFNLEDLKGAFADINRAVELNPDIAKYYMARGAVKLMLNNFMGAFEDVNKAIELDENNSVYYVSRANIKLILKSYNSALSDYNKAIKLDPENPSYYILRADFKYHFGDYEGSLKDYNTAIMLDPENPEYYILRAPIKQGFGDIEGCLADYDKAISLDPEEDYFYNIRAITKESMEDYEGAIEDFNMAISLNPENPDYYYSRALAISDRDGEDASLDDYDNAIDLDPLNPVYHYGRGLAFQDKGDYEAAMEDFNNAIALNEKEPEFYFSRALLNTEYDFYKEALPDMDKAIELDPNNAEYYYERGLAKEKLNDKYGSLEDFKSAYRLEPKNQKYKNKIIKRLY